MTRIPFDQLAKQYLQEFLEPLGTVRRHLEVPGESKFVDLWFSPAAAPPETAIDLGLLSQIATTPCLLEPFSTPPNRHSLRTCLLKLFWVQDEARRQAKAANTRLPERYLPRLWILAASLSQPVITEFGGQREPEGLAGIYWLAPALKTAVIALDQLPPTEETLWLRLLGRGPTLKQAIEDLLALPADDTRRNRALQLLVNWRMTLELSDLAVEEQDLMSTLSQAYLDWERQTEQRGRQQGLQQGVQQGAQQEARSLVLRQLTRKLGPLPEPLQSHIMALALPDLEALGEALLEFSTVADLEAWLQGVGDRG